MVAVFVTDIFGSGDQESVLLPLPKAAGEPPPPPPPPPPPLPPVPGDGSGSGAGSGEATTIVTASELSALLLSAELLVTVARKGTVTDVPSGRSRTRAV